MKEREFCKLKIEGRDAALPARELAQRNEFHGPGLGARLAGVRMFGLQGPPCWCRHSCSSPQVKIEVLFVTTMMDGKWSLRMIIDLAVQMHSVANRHVRSWVAPSKWNRLGLTDSTGSPIVGRDPFVVLDDVSNFFLPAHIAAEAQGLLCPSRHQDCAPKNSRPCPYCTWVICECST